MRLVRAPGTVPPTQPPLDWTPPMQRLPRRPRLSATWESWAGDVWSITDPRSPVFAFQGVTGLAMGEPTHHLSERILGGARWDGYVDPAGEVFLPIRVDGPTLESFADTDARFVRSLDPGYESVMRAVRPDGSTRHIPLRCKSGTEPAEGPSSLMLRRATYGLTLLAADPYWRGDEVVWEARDLPAYPVDGTSSTATGSQFSFFPGPPWTAGVAGPSPVPTNPQFPNGARVLNPGEVPDGSYPRFRVGAPFTGFRAGIAGSVVAVTLTKTAGYVEVDGDPRKQTITDDTGADVRSAATNVQFSPIPPGEAALDVAVYGRTPGAWVELRFHPRFRRAW